MRATPVGRRNKQKEQTRNLAYEPFKEDVRLKSAFVVETLISCRVLQFEWIVQKMKSDRFRLMHEPVARATSANDEVVADVAIDMEVSRNVFVGDRDKRGKKKKIILLFSL